MAALERSFTTFGQGRRLVACVVTLATLLGAGCLAAPDSSAVVYRWTTKDGRVFPARFLRVRGGATVFMRDGVEYTVRTLFFPSRAWIKSIASTAREAPPRFKRRDRPWPSP